MQKKTAQVIEPVESKRFQLNATDVKSWLRIAALFLAPIFIMYIVYVEGNIDDGFAWSDFAPNTFMQGAIVAYVLNEALALLKKFVEGDK